MVDWSRYAEGALIIKQMKQMGINMPYFGSDGQAHPKFRELGAGAAEGAYYPTHFSVTAIGGNKVAQDFTAKIRAAYNKDPDFVHAQAFDAMTATIMAIQKAGAADRTKIRDALRLSSSTAFVAALSSTKRATRLCRRPWSSSRTARRLTRADAVVGARIFVKAAFGSAGLVGSSGLYKIRKRGTGRSDHSGPRCRAFCP